MLIAESQAEAAEQVRHFQPLADTIPPSGGHEVRHDGVITCNASSGLTVAQTVAGGDAQVACVVERLR